MLFEKGKIDLYLFQFDIMHKYMYQKYEMNEDSKIFRIINYLTWSSSSVLSNLFCRVFEILQVKSYLVYQICAHVKAKQASIYDMNLEIILLFTFYMLRFVN